jgi:NADH-quinone oxidoreductase subunit M
MGFYPKPVLDLINPTSAKVVVDAGYSDPIAEVNK